MLVTALSSYTNFNYPIETSVDLQAIFEALEDTIYQLKKQLKVKEAEMMNVRMSVAGAQERAVTVSQRLR